MAVRQLSQLLEGIVELSADDDIVEVMQRNVFLVFPGNRNQVFEAGKQERLHAVSVVIEGK